MAELYSYKIVDDYTYGYKTPNSIVLIGTRVVSGSGDYRKLLTSTEILTMLKAFDTSITTFNAMQKCALYTCNGDADTANVHFYEPEWWASGDAYYQYFYPSIGGGMRINFRLEYIIT